MDTLDVRQTADLLHLHVKRVQNLAREGKLPAMRIGRRWLFPKAEMERLLRRDPMPSLSRPDTLDLSARNRLRGRVSDMRVEGLMAEIVINFGEQEIVSLITRTSAERMGIKVGSEVIAVIKSTEVMIGLPGGSS